jgi:hypothetical protein
MRNTVLLIAICTLLNAPCQMASADPVEGAYLTLEGGVNFLQDNDLTVTVPGPTEITGELFYNTGWAMGAAAGYGWANGLALEAEMAYRQNGIDGEEVMGTPIHQNGQSRRLFPMLICGGPCSIPSNGEVEMTLPTSRAAQLLACRRTLKTAKGSLIGVNNLAFPLI